MTVKSKIAINIERLRTDKGWSKAELSRRAGVERPTLSQWESGRHRPKVEAVKKLSLAFGVSMSEIDPFIHDGVQEDARQGMIIEAPSGPSYGSGDVWNDLAKWGRSDKTSAKAKEAILKTSEALGFTSRHLSGALSALSTASSQGEGGELCSAVA